MYLFILLFLGVILSVLNILLNAKFKQNINRTDCVQRFPLYLHLEVFMILTAYSFNLFILYSQLRLIEHSRIVTDFLGTGRPHSKQQRDFSLIITNFNITSLKITKILGPRRPNLSRNITLLFNWSEWTNEITRNFRWLLMV